MSNFSNRLDELLIKNKMRRADLVRATGINESTIRSWNLDGRIPSVENAIKIAHVFNMTCEELWTGTRMESICLNNDEHELIDLFRQFDNRDKADVLDIMRMKAKHYSNTTASVSNIG